MEIYNGTYCVYLHQFPNNKLYVGITNDEINPNHRWKDGFGYITNKYMMADIVKYGWDNILHIIIANHLTKSEAENLGKILIDELNLLDTQRGYNLKPGFISKGKSSPCMIQCVETGEIYNGKYEAMRSKQIKSCKQFYKALDDCRYTSGGYHWVSIPILVNDEVVDFKEELGDDKSN